MTVFDKKLLKYLEMTFFFLENLQKNGLMDLRDKNIRNLQKDDSIYKYIKLGFLC